MKPYYDEGGIMLYCGDCREVLPQLQGGVDLTLTDPPYAVGEEYASYVDTEDALVDLIKTVLPGLVKLSSVVMLTCGVPNIGLYPKPTWILAHVHPCGYGSTPWGFDCWNPILVYGKDPYLTHGMGRRQNIIYDTSQSPRTEEGRLHNTVKDEHPCVKPLELWKTLLVRGSVSVNDLILDPFCGSGTTLVAAKQLGRKAIGIELTESYCELAVRRLSQTAMDFTPPKEPEPEQIGMF